MTVGPPIARPSTLAVPRAAPAVLLRPRDAGPPVLVQPPLPRPAELEAGDVAVGLGPGVVRVKPGAQLVAERLLLGRRGQVHRGGHSTSRRSRDRPPGEGPDSARVASFDATLVRSPGRCS